MIDLNIREALQMNRPYVLVHMMTSIDGRIDCGMLLRQVLVLKKLAVYPNSFGVIPVNVIFNSED